MMTEHKEQQGQPVAAKTPPVEKTIDEKIADAQNTVDTLQKLLNDADEVLSKSQQARTAVSKKHRAALQKLVTLESIKRTQ